MPSPKEHTRKGVGLPRQYKRVSSFPIIEEIGSNKRDGCALQNPSSRADLRLTDLCAAGCVGPDGLRAAHHAAAYRSSGPQPVTKLVERLER